MAGSNSTVSDRTDCHETQMRRTRKLGSLGTSDPRRARRVHRVAAALATTEAATNRGIGIPDTQWVEHAAIQRALARGVRHSTAIRRSLAGRVQA